MGRGHKNQTAKRSQHMRSAESDDESDFIQSVDAAKSTEEDSEDAVSDQDEIGSEEDNGEIGEDVEYDCPHAEEGIDLAKVRGAILHEILSSSPFFCYDCHKSDYERQQNEIRAFNESQNASTAKGKGKGKAKAAKKTKQPAKGKKGKAQGYDDDDELAVPSDKVFQSPTDSSSSLWICLGCGHVGCGRGDSKHALEHSDSDEKHCLAFNTKTLTCWCYLCDIEVPYLNSKSSTAVKLKSVSKAVESRCITKVKESKTSLKSDLQSVLDKYDSSKVQKADADAKPAQMRGLANLGNTCFFNSVMQNLCKIKPLQGHYTSTAVPGEGPLTTALRKFYQAMWSGEKGIYNPQAVFSEIIKKAPRFRGYQQQDSHELLRYLVDGIQTEELKRLRAIAPNTKHQTYVDHVFCGSFRSSIVCTTCRKHMIVHEPFYDVSMEIRDPSSSTKEDGKQTSRNHGMTAKERKKLEKQERKGKKVGKASTGTKDESQSADDTSIAGKSESGPQSVDKPKKTTIEDEYVDLDEYASEDEDTADGDNGRGYDEDSVGKLSSKLESIEISVDDSDDDDRQMSEEEHKAIELRRRQAQGFQESSLMGCIYSFTSPELLTDEEQVKCIDCTANQFGLSGRKDEVKKLPTDRFVKRDALKQYLFEKTPPVLVLHLKRFMQNGRDIKKNNKEVPFPLDLDISPFLTEDVTMPNTDAQTPNKRFAKYRLVGIVEHSGSMSGGHYIAYVCFQGNWYYASDSSVRRTSEQEVLSAQASILFYEASSST